MTVRLGGGGVRIEGIFEGSLVSSVAGDVVICSLVVRPP
jgi:hypothetical protein